MTCDHPGAGSALPRAVAVARRQSAQRSGTATHSTDSGLATLSPWRTLLLPIVRERVETLLAHADVRLTGERPWDLRITDQRFFHRVWTGGSVALGESYMDDWWDAEALDEFFARVHRAELWRQVRTMGDFGLALSGWLLNRQSPSLSKRVAADHYDLGNDIYQAMLGKRMQYTCAYWPGAANLEEAQENKLRLIARKLHVGSGCSVLDLGGGFGGLAHFLASEYGCRVAVYNISERQVEYGRALCSGLPVRFELKDYREARSEPYKFDRVVAVGLCEHIGLKNYRPFLELAAECLCPGGLLLVHTIGSNISTNRTDAWVDKYVFPGGMIPSIAQLGAAMEGIWTMEDWHNFGPDYDRTLMTWWSNFAAAWPELRSRYSESFYRMWKYYLLSCAGAFRARKLQLWQIVLSRGDNASYPSVR